MERHEDAGLPLEFDRLISVAEVCFSAAQHSDIGIALAFFGPWGFHVELRPKGALPCGRARPRAAICQSGEGRVRQCERCRASLARKMTEYRLSKLARLPAIVFVAAENIREGIGNDQAGPVFLGCCQELRKERRLLGSAAFHVHQHVVLAEPRQPSHRLEVSEGTAVMCVDVLLPPVHFGEVILGEQQQ